MKLTKKELTATLTRLKRKLAKHNEAKAYTYEVYLRDKTLTYEKLASGEINGAQAERFHKAAFNSINAHDKACSTKGMATEAQLQNEILRIEALLSKDKNLA